MVDRRILITLGTLPDSDPRMETFSPSPGLEDDPDFISLESAEEKLDFLAQQNMVVIDGDLISLHPRFAHLLDDAEDC
jgi:hypothetical protein